MTATITTSICSSATHAKPLTENEAERLFKIYREYCHRPHKGGGALLDLNFFNPLLRAKLNGNASTYGSLLMRSKKSQKRQEFFNCAQSTQIVKL